MEKKQEYTNKIERKAKRRKPYSKFVTTFNDEPVAGFVALSKLTGISVIALRKRIERCPSDTYKGEVGGDTFTIKEYDKKKLNER